MAIFTKRPLTHKQLIKLDDLCPEATSTYKPIKHSLVAETVKRYAEAHLGPAINESYGTSADGLRFFGCTTFESPLSRKDDRRGPTALAIGYRSGYDKRLSLGLVSGSSVMVCENLCFAGDFRATRRHTKNVMSALSAVLAETIRAAKAEHVRGEAFYNLLAENKLSDREFYRLMGLCLGERALSSSQVTAALKDWRRPRYKEFEPRDAWSAYNCANESLKITQPEKIISSHVNLNRVFISSFPSLWAKACGVI